MTETRHHGRVYQIGVAASQFLNSCLGGWADESISSRAWRCRDRRRWAIAVWIIDTVFRLFGQRGHCQDAYEGELEHRQRPPEMRSCK